MSETPKTNLKGSCKCGFIRYTVDAKVDKTDGSLEANRCNCTFCQKFSTTNIMLDGPEDFHLESPASVDELGAFCPRVKTLPRQFCKTCGTHVFMAGFYPLPGGGRRDMFSVNIATIDQPQDGLDLKNVKLRYFNGLYDKQFDGTADTNFSGGLV